MTIDWAPFCELVKRGERFVLTSHQRPDCDALGSELGLAGLLEQLGKEVRIVNADATPERLSFIDPQSKIEQLGERDTAGELSKWADVLIVVDTSAWIQLGTMGDVLQQTTARKVVIDHHVSEDDLGAASFKNPQAEATGRLIVEVADALGLPLSRTIARPLLAAIATDTGWFRFSSVSGDTYRIVGRLLDAGAVPHEVYAQLYEQESLSRILLRGRILSGVKSEAAGRLIWSESRQSDFAAAGATVNDTEEVINMLLRVAGTQAAILFTELPEEKVKVSFRSRDELDVRAVAEQFGGGGHIQAAGATVSGSVSAVEKKVLDAMRKAME